MAGALQRLRQGVLRPRRRPASGSAESYNVIWAFSSKEAIRAASSREKFVEALARTPFACNAFEMQIVFSELVSNVVKHAPGPIEIRYEIGPQDAALRVFDTGAGFVPRATLPTDLYAENGRGLALVRQFCSELTVEISSERGTCVSAYFVAASGANADATLSVQPDRELPAASRALNRI